VNKTLFCLTYKEGDPLNPTLKLLKAKRTSALVDARKMEAQLARLDKEAEAAGTATNLRYIVGMYRDYSATLDEAIKSAHAPRHRKAMPSADATAQFGSSATNRWHQQMQNTAPLS
jgi:hypothetical protein